MSAISRMTRAAAETQRTDRGENRIPAVWRARVVAVRKTSGANDPGVYITVPNFTRGEIHGPVQVVGDAPTEGDLVVAVAVESRKNDWIIITSGGLAELEHRLTAVERQTSATQNQLNVLDEFVEQHVSARIGAVEEDLDHLTSRIDATPGIEIDTSLGTLVTIGGVPISYDSGWRDITVSHGVGLWDGSMLLVRRTLDELIWSFSVRFAEAGSGSVDMTTSLSAGWRPLTRTRVLANQGGSGIMHSIRVWETHGRAEWQWAYSPGSWGYSEIRPTPTSTTVTGAFAMPAAPELPTTLLGTPA